MKIIIKSFFSILLSIVIFSSALVFNTSAAGSIIAFSKMVSLGSVAAAILFPVLTLFMQKEFNFVVVIFSFLIGLLVVFNHRSNIKRIKQGKRRFL